MGEREFTNYQGVIVDDDGRTFTLSEPAELEYSEEYYELYDIPKLDMLTNETATLNGGIIYFDHLTLEKMLGRWWFCDFAMRWAYLNRKDLFYRMRNAKRKRIFKKYLSRIADAYRDHLRGAMR